MTRLRGALERAGARCGRLDGYDVCVGQRSGALAQALAGRRPPGTYGATGAVAAGRSRALVTTRTTPVVIEGR
jgi:hypothetical protein